MVNMPMLFRSLRTELPWPVILYCLKNTLILPLDCEVHVSWLTGIFTDRLDQSSFLPAGASRNQLLLLAAPAAVQDIDLPVLHWASRL